MRTMLAVNRPAVWCALVIAAGLMAVPRAQESSSGPLVGQLVTLMTQHQLEAFGAEDPGVANGFVAALLFGKTQLLVVSGTPTDPAIARAELAYDQFRELYATLQEAVQPNTKLFVQDLGADGLQPKPQADADVVYEHVTNRMIFDGNPSARHISDARYREQLSAVDKQYSRVVTVLVNELQHRKVAAS